MRISFFYGFKDILCRLAAPVPINNRHLQLRHDDFTKATEELYACGFKVTT